MIRNIARAAWVPIAAASLALASPAWGATVTYNYSGNPYTSGLFESGSGLFGTITVELPDDYANLPFGDWSSSIRAYYFLTGDCCFQVQYFGTGSSGGNFDFFHFSTDAAGNILDWSIWVTDFTTNFGFVTTSQAIANPPAPISFTGAFDVLNTVINGSVISSVVAGDPGTWLVSDPLPEPGSWALMLAGLGLLGVAARVGRG
jgi:hypothetical protein